MSINKKSNNYKKIGKSINKIKTYSNIDIYVNVTYNDSSLTVYCGKGFQPLNWLFNYILYKFNFNYSFNEGTVLAYKVLNNILNEETNIKNNNSKINYKSQSNNNLNNNKFNKLNDITCASKEIIYIFQNDNGLMPIFKVLKNNDYIQIYLKKDLEIINLKEKINKKLK